MNYQRINAEDVKDIIITKLDNVVGRGRRISMEDLSSRSGINANTLGSYRTGQNAMPIDAFLKIGAALEYPGFINGPLEIIGWGGAHPVDKSSALNFKQLTYEISKTITEMLKHNLSGDVDHREKLQQKEMLIGLVSFIQGYIANLS